MSERLKPEGEKPLLAIEHGKLELFRLPGYETKRIGELGWESESIVCGQVDILGGINDILVITTTNRGDYRTPQITASRPATVEESLWILGELDEPLRRVVPRRADRYETRSWSSIEPRLGNTVGSSMSFMAARMLEIAEGKIANEAADADQNAEHAQQLEALRQSWQQAGLLPKK